jgi:hypothetical protein
MNDRFEELVSAYLDGDDDAGMLSELRTLLEARPELHDRFRGEVRLHTLVREIASEAAGRDVRPAGRRRRTFRPARYVVAAAALILLAAGVWIVSSRRGPLPVGPPPGESALARLVRASKGAETVEDLRNLHGLARSAHEEELDLGDGCNLERLVLLGLSERICEVPRDPRQAEGLRFVVSRATRLGTDGPRAARRFGIMSSAEAAAPAMTIEQKRLFRQVYLESRDYLKKKDYYLYAGRVSVMCRIAGRSALERTTRLSYAYVLVWERDISAAVLEYCEGWLPGSMYEEHYRSYLRPLVVEKVERARALAANLGFDVAKVRDNRRVEKGWFVGAPEGAIVVEQVYTNRDNAVRVLEGAPFLEAEFTGLIRKEKGSPGKQVPESHIGVLFSLERKTGKMIWLPGEWTPLREWVPGSKELHRWTYFRLHVKRLANGSWRHTLYLRWEGDFEEVNVQDETWSDPTSRGPARVGLACNRAAAKWSELRLRIIEPAEEN